jgi:hypothetical protein
MGEVFREVKEKFERYKFDVIYIDKEYTVNVNTPQAFFELGERNAFSGLLINEGQAVIDVILLKKSHEGTSPIPGEGSGIKLSAAQILKFYNIPIAEIIANYDPNNVSGVSSNVKLKGTIHPLFEMPSQISVENLQPDRNYLIYSGFGTSLPQTYVVPANGYLVISISNPNSGNIGQVTLSFGTSTMTFNLETGQNKIPVITGIQISKLSLASPSLILIYEEVIG